MTAEGMVGAPTCFFPEVQPCVDTPNRLPKKTSSFGESVQRNVRFRELIWQYYPGFVCRKSVAIVSPGADLPYGDVRLPDGCVPGTVYDLNGALPAHQGNVLGRKGDWRARLVLQMSCQVGDNYVKSWVQKKAFLN
jgi:hypothetical protein